MAPRKSSSDSTSNTSTISGNNVSASTTISATSATDSILPAAGVTPTTSVESPTATALFNTATVSPVTSSSAPAGHVNAAPTSAPSNSGQSSTSVKIIGGIVAALIGILIIFAVAIFYLKRRWKAKEQESARRAVHDAKVQRDEEEGGGEGTAFIGDRKVHAREDSMVSTRSKSSTDDYLKTGRKRSSIGTYYTPGVAPEEAYMMFGGSRADLEEEEQRPLTYHERHLSENSAGSNRNSWASGQSGNDPRSRRISLLDDDSRYPTINSSTDELGRRGMRQSVSYPPGIVDPFSDTTPTTSPPKAPHRAFTTGDVTSPTPNPAGVRSPPAGAQAPMTPDGRRVSLKGGVGVRQNTSPGSPVGSPKAAWK